MQWEGFALGYNDPLHGRKPAKMTQNMRWGKITQALNGSAMLLSETMAKDRLNIQYVPFIHKELSLPDLCVAYGTEEMKKKRGWGTYELVVQNAVINGRYMAL